MYFYACIFVLTTYYVYDQYKMHRGRGIFSQNLCTYICSMYYVVERVNVRSPPRFFLYMYIYMHVYICLNYLCVLIIRNIRCIEAEVYILLHNEAKYI